MSTQHITKNRQNTLKGITLGFLMASVLMLTLSVKFFMNSQLIPGCIVGFIGLGMVVMALLNNSQRAIEAESSQSSHVNVPSPTISDSVKDASCSEFIFKITSISDCGDERADADLVKFDVIDGEPSELEVTDFLESFCTSACNISYNSNSRSGELVDLNFEFCVGQSVNTRSAKRFYV